MNEKEKSTPTKPEEVFEAVYRCYGTGSGSIFGMGAARRPTVEAIIKATLIVTDHPTQAARIAELEDELEDLKALFTEQGKLMGTRTRENDDRWKTVQALTAQVKRLKGSLEELCTVEDRVASRIARDALTETGKES